MNSNGVETTIVPTESVEQQHLFQWARMASGKWPELELMYHIPNEGKRTRAGGGRMKAERAQKRRAGHLPAGGAGGASRAVH